jgi:hypothetical protein
MGFGTASFVIVDLLSETTVRFGKNTLSPHGAHRVSALMVGAFIAGRRFRPHGIDESDPIALLLLDAAEAIGRGRDHAQDNERLASD